MVKNTLHFHREFDWLAYPTVKMSMSSDDYRSLLSRTTVTLLVLGLLSTCIHGAAADQAGKLCSLSFLQVCCNRACIDRAVVVILCLHDHEYDSLFIKLKHA